MEQIFNAVIKSNRVTYIELPFDASKVFNVKGKIQVSGELNGCSYKKSLIPRGNGQYILTINKTLLNESRSKVGDNIQVSMMLDNILAQKELDITEHEDVVRCFEMSKKKRKSDEIMNVLEAIFTRRSIRKFTGKKIKDEDIFTIIKAGCYAPSAENKRPWDFVVVREKKALESISVFHPRARMITQAGCAIVVCGDKEIQSQIGFLIEDCSAAIENMLLAAHGLNLGAVWCGLYPITKFTKPMKNLLDLPVNMVPVGLVVLGDIDEEKEIVYRFEKEKVHFEKW
ncbi:nitroreductase family protein [Vallitalea okinawensis]|uniref:nitroreductase family protein n=1 Tax=Vallitalea okinawensis TaxID=2078660 RepID=UPI000CFBCAB9|nr:nitroreductase family protein [Vallitalea okinawensis]